MKRIITCLMIALVSLTMTIQGVEDWATKNPAFISHLSGIDDASVRFKKGPISCGVGDSSSVYVKNNTPFNIKIVSAEGPLEDVMDIRTGLIRSGDWAVPLDIGRKCSGKGMEAIRGDKIFSFTMQLPAVGEIILELKINYSKSKIGSSITSDAIGISLKSGKNYTGDNVIPARWYDGSRTVHSAKFKKGDKTFRVDYAYNSHLFGFDAVKCDISYEGPR